MKRTLVICCALLLVATAVESALPPSAYKKARQDAPYHVQVEISRLAPPATLPGDCMVQGTIVAIFRDTQGKLGRGAVVRFPIACHAGRTPPVAGGTIRTDFKYLKRARYMEVYLGENGGALVPALWQSRIIEAPSSTPRLPAD